MHSEEAPPLPKQHIQGLTTHLHISSYVKAVPLCCFLLMPAFPPVCTAVAKRSAVCWPAA